MIGTALSLSILTTSGLVVTFQKLPPRLKEFFIKHELLTEILAMLLEYIILGGTLTALFAGALVGLQISVLLYIVNRSEQFEYLNDFKQAIVDTLNKLSDYLRQIGEGYRKHKLA